VVKNKMAPPFKEAEFDIVYGEGISRTGDILDLATNLNLVDKSGAWYSFKGERIGQGRECAKAFLKEHPEVLEALEEQVYRHHGIKRPTRVRTTTAASAADPARVGKEPTEAPRAARGDKDTREPRTRIVTR
jgi:recombination protein RecA